ncbi:SDR family NAD(P)-dependent oxidoreductase [Pseudomonas sp. NPDC089554]|uniref:type I polyketide synthase n=1 Tax=Pseudomonas sp. NPDC089554 TaxID=3390653 RepID=UPI003D04EF7F
MERSNKPDSASALQQALVSVRQLKAALQRHEEPIAIVGAACRLPGADSLAAYWSLMTQQRDAIEEVPSARWSNTQFYDPDPMAAGKLSTRWAGVIDERAFDAGFFGISDVEAEHMDAQQRIFLEVAWEALVHAGQTRERLRGSQTGVYVGVVNYNDGYARRLFDDIERVNAFSGPGVSNSVLAGRLAYLFDLKGPCLAIDTACSSSLVAVHQACQSLRNSECEQAIAGGVNLVLSPDFTVATSRMGLMAADGRCKPFDERADGIVRSDGCGVIVLKRLSDARRDGDQVLALIQASAVNQDGRTNGMTAPNGLAQEALLRGLLARAGLSADSLGYVETHGTGTKLGDPIEVTALANVLGRRAQAARCLVGSVKGNIGHCEAAAGIASLIKTVLCLQHRSVPGFADLRSLNRHIDAQVPLAFPQTHQPWPTADGTPLYALVSSFGWSGTNAQVILGSAPQDAATVMTAPPTGSAQKLALVFSGQGSQWPGMVDQLLAQDEVFRDSLQRSEAIIQRLDGWSLLRAIAAQSETDLAQTRWAQPCVVAIQLALFDMLLSWGVEPAAVAGHSIGELSAACCAGILSREQTLQAALARGRCMAKLHGQGSMQALLAPMETVEQVLADCPGASVSAFNSPGASIVSVAAGALTQFRSCCAAAGVEAITVNEHYPFHCALLNPLEHELLAAFGPLSHGQALLPFVSSSHGQDEAQLPDDAGYWVRNALRPVRFDLAIARLAELGCETFIELGPHASLVQHIQRCLGVSHPGLRAMAVLNRHKPLQQSLNALRAGLHEAGHALAANLDDATRHHTWQHSYFALPSLAVAKAPPAQGLTGRLRDNDGAHRRLFEASWQGAGLLADHCLFDRVVVPGALHLGVIATQAMRSLQMSAVCIRDVRFLRPLLMAQGAQCDIRIEWSAAGGEGEYQVAVSANAEGTTQVLSSGTALPVAASSGEALPAMGAAAQPLDAVAFYARARANGLQLGPLFRRIATMHLDEHAQLMQVQLLASSEVAQGEGLVLDPGMLDACFQALFAGYWQQCPQMALYIPLAVEEMTLYTAVEGALTAIIRLTTKVFDPDTQILQGDILLQDDQGRQVAFLRNVQLKRAQRGALLSAEHGIATQVCRLAWRERATPAPTADSALPVVLDDEPLAGLLASRLVQAGRLLANHANPSAQPAQWVDTGGQGLGPVQDWSQALGERLQRLRHLCLHLDASATEPVHLSVVTRGAHDPEAGDNHLLGAATLAVLRVIASEFPNVRCQAIDLPAQWPPAPEDLDTLVVLLGQHPAANALRVAGGQVYEQVVEPLADEPAQALPVQPDGRYLVTGGFGDTGQALLQALVARGARQVTLMGRSRPPQPLLEAARRLNQEGVEVHLFQGDLASAADVEALMRHVQRKGQPVVGVLHLAGVVEDGLLSRLDPQAVQRVLAPKVNGTLNLHAALQGQPLQWFVAFSSLSACIGLAGQSAYAAANAFVQAFMAQRQGAGQVGHAIAWGPWAAGMTARLSLEHQQHLQALGLGQMQTDEVVRWALAGGQVTPQATTIIAKALPGTLDKRLSLQGRAAPTAHADESLGDPVALQGSPDQLRAAMTRLVIEELSGTARNAALAGDTPLAGLGLDSLGAVAIVQRIRQRTGKTLPITAFFDSPTLDDVVAKLLVHA